MKRFFTILAVLASAFILAIDTTSFKTLQDLKPEPIVLIGAVIFLLFIFFRKSAKDGLSMALKLLMILSFLQPLVIAASILYSINTHPNRYPELGLFFGLIVWIPFSIFFIIVGIISFVLYKTSLRK